MSDDFSNKLEPSNESGRGADFFHAWAGLLEEAIELLQRNKQAPKILYTTYWKKMSSINSSLNDLVDLSILEEDDRYHQDLLFKAASSWGTIMDGLKFYVSEDKSFLKEDVRESIYKALQRLTILKNKYARTKY